MERKQDRKYIYYTCGQCRDKQYYLKSEEPPVPCPDCGWIHKEMKPSDVPSQVKLDLRTLTGG